MEFFPFRRDREQSDAFFETLMVRQMEQRFQPHATVLLDARRLSHTPFYSILLYKEDLS